MAVQALAIATLGAISPASTTARDFLVSSGTNFAASPAPDGTTLAFDLQGRLWLLPAAGGRARPLTDGLGDDRLPAWSPDGSQLVYQSFRAGTFQVWTIGRDGRGARPLTRGPFDDREPVWLPDGHHVAFSSDRAGSLDIWVVDTRTGNLTALTSGPADDWWPAISPDGTRLAFISDRSGRPGLHVASLDPLTPRAGEPRLLVGSQAGEPQAPAFSPDGSRLAFVMADEQLGFPAIARQRLYVADVNTGDLQPWSTGAEDVFPFRPGWRNESSLLYTADGVIRRREPAGTVEVPFTARLQAGRGQRLLARRSTPRDDKVRGIVQPVAAPDGSGVVFVALGDLWRRDGDGRLHRLTDDSHVERDPAFSPGGDRLVFVSDRGGSMQAWVRDVASGQERQVTGLPRGIRHPVFTPDGRRLVVQQAGPRGNQDFTLHLVDLADGKARPVRAPGVWPGPMAFTRDGHLLLAVLAPSSRRYREGRNELWRINLESGAAGPLLLPPGPPPDTGPTVTPDGRQLALIRDGALWIMGLAPDGTPGDPAREAVAELVDYPSFSGDGRTVTYLGTRGLRSLDMETGASRSLPLDLRWQPMAGTGRVVVQAGRLFDGRADSYRHDVDVVIDGPRIVTVEPRRPRLPAERVIDARQATVMPGLTDSHVHFQGHDGAWVGRALLAFGITSVVEPGGLAWESREQQEAWAAGRRPGPRLFTAGPQLDGDRRFFQFAVHVGSTRRLDWELERARELDYALLKTYTRLPPALQAQVIRAGRRSGLVVSSHELYPALGPLGGQRVEHLRGTSRLGWSSKQSDLLRSYGDVLALVGEGRATIVPTVAVGGGFFDFLLARPELDEHPRYRTFYGEADRRALRALANLVNRRRSLLDAGLDNSRATIRSLAARGAVLVAGTDSPIFPYGLALVAELDSYRAAGLDGPAVLRAATSAATGSLGLGASLGRIAPGYLADLVILPGDPLADPTALLEVRTVMVNGRIVCCDDESP